MIRCITFDLDDTLWACHPVIEHAEQVTYEWLKQHTPHLCETHSITDLTNSRSYYLQQNSHLAYDLGLIRQKWLTQLLKQHGYDDPALHQKAYQVFWHARNEITFFDHALSTLQALAKHYTLGVISNGNADINHIGIGHFFDFSLSSAQAGVAKPHADIFKLAHQKANQIHPLGLHEMLYIGDNPENDVLGPNAVGMKSAWFNPDNKAWEYPDRPHIEISCLSELPHAISTMNDSPTKT